MPSDKRPIYTDKLSNSKCACTLCKRLEDYYSLIVLTFSGLFYVSVAYCNTSLKSPTLGIWFLRDLPMTFPVFDMTTAVFHRIEP